MIIRRSSEMIIYITRVDIQHESYLSLQSILQLVLGANSPSPGSDDPIDKE